ncbi:MAG: 3-dehydroquinate synthase [Enterobacterales bacterium]|nr:3-dehydroquinate synthase [Enterobacterales bacterium]
MNKEDPNKAALQATKVKIDPVVDSETRIKRSRKNKPIVSSELKLDLKDNPYTIYIGRNLIHDSKHLLSYCHGDHILIVTNDLVGPLYLKSLKASLMAKKVHHFIIPDGEIHKSQSSYFKLLDYLIENNFRRNDTLIALGGGVIGDLSGFVAASFQRGMNYLQMPTSLLAQVDSSVGGKTAINHPLGKNLIGAFYQPLAVVIDILTLRTLPDREYFSGLGEIIKYALLGEQEIEQILIDQLPAILNRDEKCLEALIYLSCQKKATIVAKDEKEKGERALLNLGHTFAHALETLTDYKRYLHGEAVAIGILMALHLSVEKQLISADLLQRYKQLIESLHLPTMIDHFIDPERFLEAMKKDKKNQSDSYRLVLVNKKGCLLVDESNNQLITSTIEHFILKSS